MFTENIRRNAYSVNVLPENRIYQKDWHLIMKMWLTVKNAFFNFQLNNPFVIWGISYSV